MRKKFQDLANMLETGNFFNFSDVLPTMVPVSLPSLFGNFEEENNDDDDNSSFHHQNPSNDDVTTANVDVKGFRDATTNSTTVKKENGSHKASSSLLDKAVEKMRLLAEAKMSDS